MILLDTSGLWSALDAREPHHAAATAALHSSTKPWLLSPFVLQELDYFFLTRLGVAQELDLLDEVARGVYQLEPFDALDVAAARAIAMGHRDVGIGLADASLVVLAERHRCLDVLTTDRRHFGALMANGRAFRMLPT